VGNLPMIAGRERIVTVGSAELVTVPTGVELRSFVSAICGAKDFSTGLATFKPGGYLQLHRHTFSEAITVVHGEGVLQVESRTYRMHALDCAHIPAGTAHTVRNEKGSETLVVHSSFASARPTRQPVDQDFPVEDRGSGDPLPGEPETVMRFAKSPAYELAEGAFFTDLFARRFGAVGICGGYGRFRPGASLPCHTHHFDESITIVTGEARCMVEGRPHVLSHCATAYVPEGLPHRFLNESSEDMAMIWVYAGPEPDRQIVDNGYCSGALAWPGTHQDTKEKSETP
jgi:quercetin dioxygenase-like cupin family protein